MIVTEVSVASAVLLLAFLVLLLRERKIRIEVEKQRLEDSEKMQRASEVLSECEKAIVSLTSRLDASVSANLAHQQSRDQAWDLYRRSSLAAGHAQAWLFRELTNTLNALNQYRKKNGEAPVTAPAGLEEVLEDFKREHIEKTRDSEDKKEPA